MSCAECRIQIGHADHTVTACKYVEQAYPLALVGAGKIDDRQYRKTQYCWSGYIGFDRDGFRFQNDTFDANQGDFIRSCLQCNVLGDIQRIGRFHDGQTEVKIAERQANGIFT